MLIYYVHLSIHYGTHDILDTCLDALKNVVSNFSIFCVPNYFYCFLATIPPTSNAEKLHMLVLCQLRCMFGYVDDQEDYALKH